MILPMNLGQVIAQWNVARQQAGLGALTYSIPLARYAARYLAPWRPGLDPEANPSRYPAVLVQMVPAAGWTPTMVAQGLLGSPYHRAIILDPDVSRVGIVEDCQGGTCVVLAEFSGPAARRPPPFVLWIPPAVPERWQDWEYPNPFPIAQGATAGYPLSVATTGTGQVTGAEIIGPNGSVPVWRNQDQYGDWLTTALVIAPRAPLSPGRYVLRFWWEPSVGRPQLVERAFTVV